MSVIKPAIITVLKNRTNDTFNKGITYNMDLRIKELDSYDNMSTNTHHRHDDISRRWQEADYRGKWDTKADHGYCGEAPLPKHLQH